MQFIDIVYLSLYFVMLYSSILWFTVFFSYRNNFFKNPKPKNFSSISFLIPVHNEKKNIKKCIISLLNLDYPKEKIKIFVVDDGSTDCTKKIVLKIAKKLKNIKLIEQEHKGKGAAINNGLRYVKTELVACMDADSSPDKNYLKKMIGYFNDEKVGLVTPALKVAKVDSLMRKIQWIEYLFSIYLRKLFSYFQCQYVAPGPGSIYRTEILKKIGGFDEKNLTEDMEIAFRFVDKNYKTENCVDAYVKTDSPKDFMELFGQRIRWYRGYIQNVKKYSHMILNPKFGDIGMFLLPINFFWMFALVFLLFAPLYTLINSSISYIVYWGYINYHLMPLEIEMSVLSIDFYSFFGVLFLLFTMLIIWASIYSSREKIELKKRLVFYIAFMLLYPILISLFWTFSIFFEILGVKRKW